MTNKKKYQVTVLGSGTSSGIPTIGCQCPVCLSDDPKDKRLRCSLLIESDETTILIDTTPDFRQQMLREKVRRLDAVLYTHHHFDHIGGFDDIRAFNYIQKKSMPLYFTEKTYKELKRTFIYAFETPEQMGGGVPLIEMNFLNSEAISIGGIANIIPLDLFHGKLHTLGFRINNFAYCTDTNNIPDSTMEKLQGVETLIIDALRYTPHSTHFNLDQAIAVSKEIGAKQTYFTHMAHQIKHQECNENLPENMQLAYDGLKFVI